MASESEVERVSWKCLPANLSWSTLALLHFVPRPSRLPLPLFVSSSRRPVSVRLSQILNPSTRAFGPPSPRNRHPSGSTRDSYRHFLAKGRMLF